MSEQSYFLDQDSDGHWYLVRVDFRAEWNEWMGLDPEDKLSWSHPHFAEQLGGHPNQVTFIRPHIIE